MKADTLKVGAKKREEFEKVLKATCLTRHATIKKNDLGAIDNQLWKSQKSEWMCSCLVMEWRKRQFAKTAVGGETREGRHGLKITEKQVDLPEIWWSGLRR